MFSEEHAENTLAKPVLGAECAVYQRSLADWYVEYEIFAHMDKPLARVPVLSALHANIQDQFNTYGVQIMSPHSVLQPRNSVTVQPDNWRPALAAQEPLSVSRD